VRIKEKVNFAGAGQYYKEVLRYALLKSDSGMEIRDILNTEIIKGSDVWIADTARVFGRVTLGDQCSVWFGAVLRGDGDDIVLGARTNVQEGAVVHVDPGFPARTGHSCIIGHGAILHGATLGNHVLLGMHATVLNGAVIGNNCIIGAHALVTEGMKIPSGSLVLGAPAKVVKQLSEAQVEKVRTNADVYVRLGAEYLAHWPGSVAEKDHL
jgi:carbonic anhydrase/acetyltransferase-like protein (isoleucine patch superfamily)